MKEKKVEFLRIDVSTWTFVKVLLLVMIIWFLYLIRDILAILFFSLILSSAIDPFVDWLVFKKIPRALAVFFIYIILIGVIASIFALIVPALILQSQELIGNLPLYFKSFSSGFESLKYYSSQYGLFDNIEGTLKTLLGGLNVNTGVFSFLSNLVGGIFSFVLILVITFYMLVSENALKKSFQYLAPPKYLPYLTQLFHRIQQKIGLWLRGQLVLSLIIGVMSYVGLLFIGMPYALVLALIAALAELVPYIGPVLGSIPAIFIAFTIDPILAVAVLVIYVVIQQLENNILVPKIMQKAIGLNPIISISSLLIGAKVAGVLGAIMAIPVATALSVVVIDFFNEKEDEFFEKEKKL